MLAVHSVGILCTLLELNSSGISLDLGHSWGKKKERKKGAAVSKISLVQQSFGVELVLVTSWSERKISGFLPVGTQILFFCVTCGYSLAWRKNDFCLLTFCSFTE